MMVPFPVGFQFLLGKGHYGFGSVDLSVSEQHYSKGYEQIGMKFSGGVRGGKGKN